ncbi:MAG TPA: TonB-dependent receptor, partial [Bryobacteraceae bacterium]
LSVVATPAFAQDAATSIEEVVVTGTSIRGVAPVGSNLISVTTADIEATGAQTLQQMLNSVPALTGMGAIGQGTTNNSYFQPTIHQIGGSSSNATLVIVDGHRMAPGGTNHSNTVDPNIIPTAMVERVEVLTDGSSSVYGSDAVTGVINFITRKKFNGVQLNVQSSVLRGATDWTGGVLAGVSSEHSSLIFAWQYTDEGSVANTAEPWTYPEHSQQAAAAGFTGTGSTNFLNDNCDPATIQPNGSGSVYFVNAQSATTISSAQGSSICSSWKYGQLVPKEVRDDVMLKGTQDIGPNLTLETDLGYATLRDTSHGGRGSITATVYGAGPQANPFYTNPPGVTATKQTIRYDFNNLLGPGAVSTSGVDSVYADGNLEYRIGDNFVVDLLGDAGRTLSFANSDGSVNSVMAALALNGTSQTGGSTTTPALPGTTLIVNAPLPLTTATALDVWNPAASNRTSAAVLSGLTDNASRSTETFGYQQLRLSTNGTLFDLPAGPVKIALGGEIYRTQLQEFKAAASGAGPASTSSSQTNLSFEQNDKSAYAEAIIPVISEEMAVPLIKNFAIDVSGRYDDYDTVGSTENPKVAFNWTMFDWLRLRGNSSTSFVAPVVDIRGQNNNGYYVGNTFGGSTPGSITVSTAAYPLVTQEGIAGCTATSVTCNIASLTGVTRRSGDGNVQPQKGRGWSFGADFNPDFLPGFTAQATLWHTTLIGGVTAPNFNNVVVTGSLQKLVTLTPTCATAAQVAAIQGALPLTSTIPACVQYLFYDANSNYLNLKVDGVDASFNFSYPTDNWGTFKIADTATVYTRFKEAFAIGGAGAYYNVLNSTGANSSFPSVAIQQRTDLGWGMDAFALDVFLNFTSAYRNWNGSSVNPLTSDANNNPAGGGDHEPANITVDTNMSYDFQAGMFGNDQISLHVRNLLNQKPPYLNSSGGWDTWVASPLGRIVTVSLRSTF